MIISHKHKFIFIKTQKTAGTSMEISLSKYCGNKDIITKISIEDEIVRQNLGFHGPQNYQVPFHKYTRLDWVYFFLKGARKVYYNHMTAAEIRSLVGSRVWSDYYKFCFERNPFDKMVSLYHHMGGNSQFSTIDNFLTTGLHSIVKGYDQYTIKGNVAVDDIFKFEELDSALEKISKRIGLNDKLEMVDFKAKSRFRKDRRPYTEVLTSSERKRIETIWAREIRLMNYTY